MKTEFELSRELTSNIKHWFDLSLTSDQMMTKFNEWRTSNCFTPSGNNRYRKGYIDSLLSFFMATKSNLESFYCVFGYWYKNEFYTTHSYNSELVKRYDLKTTNDLREHFQNMRLKVWDNCKRGQYYASNLKPFYDHSPNESE